MGYSNAVIYGNLTKDVDMRYTPTGTAVAAISVAVNTKYTSGGEQKEDVSYFDVKAFGKIAENCAKYIARGSSVLVAGRLKQERWQDNDGGNRSKVVIMADNVQFLSKPAGEKHDAPEDEELTPF